MRFTDPLAVQLLDIVTADLEVGDSRCIDAAEDFPPLYVDRVTPHVFVVSQRIHSDDEAAPEVTRVAVWHHRRDQAWMLLALMPVYADDVWQTEPGVKAISPRTADNCRTQAVYAAAWLGIIIPFQQGGWSQIRAVVNGSRSA